MYTKTFKVFPVDFCHYFMKEVYWPHKIINSFLMLAKIQQLHLLPEH